MSYHYSLYGLVFQVPFFCSGLVGAPMDSVPDVIISPGDVPEHLSDMALTGDRWEALPGQFLSLGGHSRSRFLVQDPRTVIVQRHPSDVDDAMALQFLHDVIAAVLRYRGLLVLHASTCATPKGAVVICGPSGAGKSTTVAALESRGCRLLSDDVTALQVMPNGEILVLPGAPRIYLCDDASNRLIANSAELAKQSVGRRKVIVPSRERTQPAPAPLRSIFMLGQCVGIDIDYDRLSPIERFDVLQDCLYGPVLREEHPAHFPLFAAVAQSTPFYRLTRPCEGWSVDLVLDAIMSN